MGFQDSTIIAGYISAGAAITGSIIGMIGTVLAAKSIARHSNRLEAYERLKIAFAPTIAFLYACHQNPIRDGEDVTPDVEHGTFDSFMLQAWENIAPTVAAYKYHVKNTNKAAYKKACDDYFSVIKKGQFHIVYDLHENRNEALIKKIESILSVAKP